MGGLLEPGSDFPPLMDLESHFPFGLYGATFRSESDFLGTFWGLSGSIVVSPNLPPFPANEVQHVLMSISSVSHSCPLGLGEASALFGIKDCQTKVEGMHIYNMLQPTLIQ